MKKTRLLSGLLLSVVLAGTTGAQTVHSLEDSERSFTDLFAHAYDRAAHQDSWIAFSFDKEMCVRCFTGWKDWDSNGERTIEDTVLGREPTGRTVQEAVRLALDDFDSEDADQREVMKEVAILIHIEDGAISDISHANISTPFTFERQPVYWLGNRDRSDILVLFDHRSWSGFRQDSREGWVWTIGALDLADASLSWLERAYKDEREVDVRKAIAYAMGSLDTESSVRTLERIIRDDPSQEVQKAAIYAIGNNDSDAARDVLLDIIRTMGSTSSS